VLSKWGFPYFNEKFKARLCGNESFGVWPEHGFLILFEGGLLCVEN
jgi:hypothetical protein